MKVVFFNTDEILLKYYENKDFKGAEVIYTELPPAKATNEHLDAEVISVITHQSLDAEILSKFPNLKLIATRSQGVNHIDMDYAAANNIAVKICHGYGEFAVPEFAMGILLALMRRIIPAHNDMRNGFINMSKYVGNDINGKTIGVFGMGTIGAAFARLARAFGSRVIVYDLFQHDDFENVSLEELYAQSDIVALNIPATAENYHIINAETIAKMKRGVIILNIARGELIDVRALYDAVMSGQVGGVAQDVFEMEDETIGRSAPNNLSQEQMEVIILNKKLMKTPRVIFTPHIAFNSIEANLRILEMTYENILSVLK